MFLPHTSAAFCECFRNHHRSSLSRFLSRHTPFSYICRRQAFALAIALNELPKMQTSISNNSVIGFILFFTFVFFVHSFSSLFFIFQIISSSAVFVKHFFIFFVFVYKLIHFYENISSSAQSCISANIWPCSCSRFI